MFSYVSTFCRALSRLEEGISFADSSLSSVARDGVIQGFVNIDSPKAVMRQALASGLIADGDGWFSLLQARNVTSHMYSEDQAAVIYQNIRQTYLPLFLALKTEMNHRL